jgi:hypothetical protein
MKKISTASFATLTIAFLTTAALLATTFLLPTPTQAQNRPPLDIGISPPTTYLQIAPGNKKTHRVTLEQKGSLPLEITPSVVDFTTDDKTGSPVLSDVSSFRHITLTLPGSNSNNANKTSFILQPGEKKNITFTLDIPPNAIEDEYLMTLLFRAKTAPGVTLAQNTSEVSGVIGSNLIALISHSERDLGKLQIEKVDAPRIVDSFSDITFTTIVKNIGKNATTASGSATITDWQGQEVASFQVYPDMILRNSSRQLRTALSLEEALEKPETISDHFTYQGLFLFGPYTITLDLAKSSQPTAGSETYSSTVIAAPFSILIVAIVSILMYLLYTIFIQTDSILSSEDDSNYQ